MRWTQAALLTRARTCGRRSRVVLTPRRWRQVSWEVFPRSDGGKRARSPGRHEISRKTIAQGRSDCFGEPVVTTLVCLFHFACEAAGAASTRLSLRPLLFEGQFSWQSSGAIRAAGMRLREEWLFELSRVGKAKRAHHSKTIVKD